MTALVTINRMGNNGISPDFFFFCFDSNWIPGWEGGGWSQWKTRLWSCAGGNTGFPPSLICKANVGFWKDDLYTHTVHHLMCLHPRISASVAYRQTLLLALGMWSDSVSERAQHHLVSFNPPLPCFCFSLCLGFCFWSGVLSDGLGENKWHVNCTTPPHWSTLPEYQVVIMKSFVWELPGLPPRLVFISQCLRRGSFSVTHAEYN